MSLSLPSSPAYCHELTGLRAVAVSIVLVQHWLPPFFPFGELGPSLFFVLSGYLVTGIIWGSGAYPGAPGAWGRRLGNFYLRRVLRIVPLYYLALPGCALLPLATVREHPAWFLLPVANLLIYKSRGWGDGIGHLWTIAVELQFYLLWPWLLAGLGRRLAPLLLLVAGSWVFRGIWAALVRPDMVHLLLPSNLDLFALGAVLSHAQGRSWLRRVARGRHVLLAWLCWATLRLWTGPGGWTSSQVLGQSIGLALADGLTIGWLLHNPGAGRRLGLVHPVVQWVGQRSYSLYLYHLPLLVFWQRLVYHFSVSAEQRSFFMQPLLLLGLLAPTLLLLSALSWRWVELPLAQFKKWFSNEKAAEKVASQV